MDVAEGRRSFQRIQFVLKTSGGGRVQAIAILPKPVGRHPVVIYLHGAGGSLLGSGNELRQVAELGLAAVGIEYDQTNQGSFDEQFMALRQYLQQQSWAQSNATAWVGFSLGAQCTLRFALRHPELQPSLIVGVASGPVLELDESEHPTSNIQHPTSNQPGPSAINPQSSTSIRCPVLLVHGELDEVFPLKECQRLAEQLRASGMPVELRVLPQLGHGFGEEAGTVTRAVAEYCEAHLPLADYCSSRRKEALTEESQIANRKSQMAQSLLTSAATSSNAQEAARFNLAMSRAGQHRRELWRAVTAFGEPERHTVMNVIGGLEDYDLAHITAAQLREEVRSAWRARRRYPWCRDAPLDIFEKFVANPRIYEEPLGKTSLPFVHEPSPPVKYCRDTGQASDAVGAWLHRRRRFPTAEQSAESPLDQLVKQSGSCREEVILYTYFGRLVGLPMRPVYVNWPTLGSGHWYAEVWSTEEQQWHPVDRLERESDLPCRMVS